MNAHVQAQRLPGRPLDPPDALRFLLRLIIWFPALLLLWLPLGGPYRSMLLAAGNTAFAASGAGREVLFLHHTKWSEIGVTETADMAVLVRNAAWHDDQGRKQHVLAKAVCTFYQPFTALAFLLALFLAGRFPGRQRLWKIGAAVSALHLAMLAAVVIDVSNAAHSVGPSDGAQGWMRTTIAMLHFSVTDWPAGVFLVPLLIWIFFCWPRRPSGKGGQGVFQGARSD